MSGSDVVTYRNPARRNRNRALVLMALALAFYFGFIAITLYRSHR